MMSDKPFTRSLLNPLLTPNDMPIATNAVLNPGVAEMDGQVILLLRIEDRRGISQIRVARSTNGVDNWKLDDKALLEPDQPENPYEEWGCEDARATQLAPDKWVIAYTAYSRYGPCVALATTKDFVEVERLGVALAPTNKDAAIFPQKFDDKWIMLHRPVTGQQEHIWYAYSQDHLNQWGQPGVLLSENGGPWWDSVRIGVGGPPLLTDQGWLLIFHGVKEMAGHPIYRLGVAMLDKDNPCKVLARASEWIFAPETEYELSGLVPNVVFTCGALTRGDETWMYYGAADTVIGLATAKTQDIVDFAFQFDFLEQIGRAKGTVC